MNCINLLSSVHQELHLNSINNKVLIILLHAFPLNSQMWKSQFKHLTQSGYSMLTLDYSGFGLSGVWGQTVTISDYSKLVFSSVQKLAVDSVVVVGLSMSGYIALDLYRSHPEIFSRLVLSNTKATADTEETKKRRYSQIDAIKENSSAHEIVHFHLDNFFLSETKTSNHKLIEFTEQMMREATIKGIINGLEAMAGRPDSLEILSTITFPVLIILGETDPFIP
ncbi:MAG: hypothetical protein AMJ61_00640 [Desulfobacterales bacterium SG8_35_2]|nr:MAG: hypothetical protein AMJ61_00640 [Desulfobacterales bacterium SG8_35_2]